MINRNKALGMVLAVAAVLALAASSVQAQTNAFDSKSFITTNSASRFSSNYFQKNLQNRTTRGTRSPAASLGSYQPPSATGFSSKPFSSISRAPTVSPYLALNNTFNQASAYYTSVRPQQEQQRMNQQLQRQGLANQHRLNQMAATGPYSPRGDEDAAPTGHVSVFQSLGTYLNTGGYFSGAPVPRR